ncbi:O-antigen ligase family protein [Piscinibacter sp.]|uniref:O-antigen ligase family protein n=1 Tax=Piscinibacter sp. TaxID=1903157 RepID=UPI0039E58E8E
MHRVLGEGCVEAYRMIRSVDEARSRAIHAHDTAQEQELHRQSSMSFFLFTLYLALNFARPVELLAPELGELRPMLWLWLLAFGAACVEAVRYQRIAASSLHILMLLGFMAAIVVSQVMQGWAGGAVYAMAVFSTSSMFFLLAALNLTTHERLVTAGKVLALSIVVMAAVGVFSYHTGWHADTLVLAQNTYDDNLDPDVGPEPGTAPAKDSSGRFLWRLHALGFLQDPNDFAQAMIVSLPLLLLGYAPGRLLRNLVFIGLPAALLLYAILLTHSRGALVGIGAMLFFGARRYLGTTRTLMLGGLLVAGALATSFGGGRAFSAQEESAGDRISAWYAGFQMFKSSPLFGIGFQNFTEHHHLTAHNSFVLCLAELGMSGYFFWMAMLVLAFLGLKRAGAAAGGSSTPELLTTALIGFLTCAWFLSRTYQPTLFLLLAMCAAAWHCATRGAVQASAPSPAAARALVATQSPWRWPWFKYTLAAIAASMALVQFFIVASR